MSRVHETLRRDGDLGQTWYLKISDGSTYGPVGLNILREWAAQSRIVPGNKVSRDGRRWVPAETVHELKMEWSTELPNGDKYGPFNVLAVPHLFHGGTLPLDAKLTNKISGKTVPVYELVKATLAHEERVLPQEKEEPSIRAPARSADMGPKELQIEFEILEPPETKDVQIPGKEEAGTSVQEFESQIKYLTLKIEQTRRDWAGERNELNRKIAAGEDKLNSQLDQLKKKADAVESESEKAKAELSAERKKHQEALEQARSREDALNKNVSQLTAELESVSYTHLTLPTKRIV